MAQYDVSRNPEGAGYLLDVQSNLLDGLNTRIVVPLLPASDAPVPAERLNPSVEIDGTAFVMTTQFLAAVPAAVLTAPVANLSERSTEITNALDMVFHGF
jgi:toxin CcdB